MTPIELVVLFASAVTVTACITWWIGKPRATREQEEEVDELKRQRTYWTRRFLNESRSKQCVIREARGWKESAEGWQEAAEARWQLFRKAVLKIAELEERLQTEITANNRAFSAGMRCAVLQCDKPYTGDEPEGVRL